MYATQKQVFESFMRVRAFIDEHPVAGLFTYDHARETLDEVLPLVREYAGTQLSAPALSRAELRHQERLIRRIKTEHMRPLVTIARAQVEADSDVRLPVALRMPASKLGLQQMIALCDGMIETARKFERVFVSQGMPADFLTRFARARDELEHVLSVRATYTGAHVGARMGIKVQLRRARLAVDRLDAIVRLSFDGDEAVLAAWRVAKRVHKLTGGAATPAQRQDSPDVAAEQVAMESEQIVGRIAPPSPGHDVIRAMEDRDAA